MPIDAVYSSDLFRTMTTARALFVPKGLPLVTRPDLREISMGQWEDYSWAGIDRREHACMALFSATSPDFRAPGGETFPEIRKRGCKAILDIAAQHPGQTVAAFAHGTLIRNVVAEFLGIPPEEMRKMGHSDNTAVTKLEIENGHVTVVYKDDNSHLSEEISTLAKQRWWNKNDQRPDVNFWFDHLDLDTQADRDYYLACRQDAWQTIYGNLDRYDGAGFLDDAYDSWKANPKSLVVAMAGSRRAGLLQLDPRRGQEAHEAYISFLYLAPEERDNGVGIQLIGKAVSLSRPLDYDKLGLVCSQQNAHALAFYQKYGFHAIGTEAGAYGTLYRMQKDIGYTVREDLM